MKYKDLEQKILDLKMKTEDLEEEFKCSWAKTNEIIKKLYKLSVSVY
jgi:hypothetical protein